MKVKVLSRLEVEAGAAEGADAIVSIRASIDGAEPELNLALAQATRCESARLLRLVFDDIGVPSFEHFAGPTMAQITEVIDFGRQVADGWCFFDGPVPDPTVVINCEHGKSRSAAIALALLADHFGDGNEQDAVKELLHGDLDDRIHPNPLVVALTDDCLFRYGRIGQALAEASPRFVKWRDFWRDVAVDPKPHADKIRQILSRRSGQPR
jgi:predicted protein tyrosine phosphatase